MVDPRRAIREAVAGLPSGFWWLWTSTLVNRVGSFVVAFLSLYLTVQRGYSASYAGLVASLFGLGGMIGSPAGGTLADRWGRRPTMLAAQLTAAASTAALGFARNPVAIAALVFAMGFAVQASRPAVQAMLSDLVPGEDRQRAYSLNYWAINIGFSVASLSAGLIAVHGFLLLFLLDAATTLLCALVVFVKLPETRPAAEPVVLSAGEEPRAEPRAGTREVLRDRRFMGLVGLNLLLAGIFAQTGIGLPISMGQDGMSSTDFGLVISVNGILIVLLQIPLTQLVTRHSPARLLSLGALLFGAGLGLTGFAGSIPLYALTVCVWSMGEIIYMPTSSAAVAKLSPPHARGRYSGIMGLSWSVANFAGPLLGGLVIDHAGTGALWAGCAVIGAVTAAGYLTLLREERSGAGTVGAGEVREGVKVAG
ncbi:MDR family MFS transporter [Streptomyces sp. NPDC059373]